ncbi:hypothetical protein [Mycolicibacterium sarraceniae]|uniref:hypothetical protein n=1 Tax=Mycolicibacterium sarraceniae TaxID=1534348 RepID=UPI0013D1B10D
MRRQVWSGSVLRLRCRQVADCMRRGQSSGALLARLATGQGSSTGAAARPVGERLVGAVGDAVERPGRAGLIAHRGVGLMMTVTCLSPRWVCRPMCSSTPITAT